VWSNIHKHEHYTSSRLQYCCNQSCDRAKLTGSPLHVHM